MKKNLIARMVMVLGLTGIMLLNPTISAMASTTDKVSTKIVTVARTKAWDGIEQTLGGVPESVKKTEYAGSIFYLGKDVTDADFKTVLTVGPEAVRLKPPKENGKLYNYPVYILWNSDKTVLLVHPIIFDYDDILEPVAISAKPPTNVKVAQTAKTVMTADEKIAYMLTDEYADAVKTEFYRLLNEYRVANDLKVLEINVELQWYADIRAEEQRERFGHSRPDGSTAGSGWYNSKNNLNSRYAENALATGAINADPKDTALGILTIWKESSGHNRHMLYKFDEKITMGFGIAPKLDKDGFVTSGAIFATGY